MYLHDSTFVYLQQGGKVSHQIQPLDGDVTTDPAVAADAALTRVADLAETTQEALRRRVKPVVEAALKAAGVE